MYIYKFIYNIYIYIIYIYIYIIYIYVYIYLWYINLNDLNEFIPIQRIDLRLKIYFHWLYE